MDIDAERLTGSGYVVLPASVHGSVRLSGIGVPPPMAIVRLSRDWDPSAFWGSTSLWLCWGDDRLLCLGSISDKLVIENDRIDVDIDWEAVFVQLWGRSRPIADGVTAGVPRTPIPIR